MMGVAVALPQSAERVVSALLRDHAVPVLAHFNSGEEVMAILQSTGSVRTIIIAADPSFLNESVINWADSVGIRLVVWCETEAAQRFARALGVLEVVSDTQDWAVWQAALAGSARSAPTASVVSTNLVISLWGPAGSPGRSTIAINVAAELAHLGHSVALVDADTYSGSIAPALGLTDEAPGFAAACRLAGTDSLTHAQLDRIADHHGQSGARFRVLTGVSNPARWAEFTAERTASVLHHCSTWVRYTIVDIAANLEEGQESMDDIFSPHRNAATLSALRQSDRVVAIGNADPIGLARYLRGHAELRRMIPHTPLVEVINRVRAGAVGPSPLGQLRHTLARFGGIHRPSLIPYDRSLADSALLGARTWRETSNRGAARLAVRDLAHRIHSGVAAQPATSGSAA